MSILAWTKSWRMVTLADYRRWLEGESIEGLPRRIVSIVPRGGLKAELFIDGKRVDQTDHGFTEQFFKRERKIPITFIRKGKYEIASDGLDARVNFGKHKGKLVSRMANESEGSTYLAWMLSEDFPMELKQAIEYQVEVVAAARKRRKRK